MKTTKKNSSRNSCGKESDPVVHFEMPAEDRKRMAKFYTKAFGWQTQFLGEDMGNYTTGNHHFRSGQSRKAKEKRHDQWWVLY